jgi:hypothetical protein
LQNTGIRDHESQGRKSPLQSVYVYRWQSYIRCQVCTHPSHGHGKKGDRWNDVRWLIRPEVAQSEAAMKL